MSLSITATTKNLHLLKSGDTFKANSVARSSTHHTVSFFDKNMMSLITVAKS